MEAEHRGNCCRMQRNTFTLPRRGSGGEEQEKKKPQNSNKKNSVNFSLPL